jgi:hypothetical protein
VACGSIARQNLETNNETTAVVKLMMETVLCKPLLGSCNCWTTTMETGVFSMCYLEDNWGDPVKLVISSAGLEPENDCAGQTSSNCKRQTHPIVREDVT